MRSIGLALKLILGLLIGLEHGGSLTLAASPTKVAITDGWIKVPPPGARTTAAYFSLKNEGQTPVTVKSVRVAGAGSAELHATAAAADGTMTMKPLKDLTLAPKSEATFAPGGMHVMIFGMPPSLTSGAKIELTLVLDGGQEIKTDLTARAP